MNASRGDAHAVEYRRSSMSHPARCLVFTLLCIPSAAFADPPVAPAPVALEVTAGDSPGRLRFALRNVSGAPVEVLADRRLLSFVAAAPVALPGVRRRRAAPPLRCVHDQRPTLNEFSARVTLEPGRRYSEEIDVADLCGLRVPAGGAQPLEFHYGFAAPRRGPGSHGRSIVTDERAEVFAEVTALAPPSLLGGDGAAAPASVAVPALLSLSARGSSAPTAAGLRVSVTLRNPSIQPVWTLLRPTQFSFVVTTPAGSEVACDGLVRQPAPLRDLFARIPAHGQRSFTLLPSMHCPLPTFQSAGLYRARARFESRASGEAFGMQRVFTGLVESASMPLRVSRGQVVPLRPRFE